MDISHLQLREIQAPIVSALIDGFAGEIGRGRAVAIAEQVIRSDAAAAGRRQAAAYGGRSLAVLSRIVREIWAAGDTLTVRFLRETENALFFDVLRCGYAELYDRLGVRSLGCTLSCTRDFHFLEGFNPKITLTRTQTIMEGADFCDFRYEKQ